MCGKKVRFMSLVLMGMLLLLPSIVAAESGYANEGYATAGTPPIGPPLIREGDFAVEMALALSLGTSRDEVEAENQLSAAGITPKNGWIADYPVTPDIADELYKAVSDAAASGKIRLSVDVALQRFNDVISQTDLSVDTQAGANPERAELPGPPSYPNSTVINNYYQTEGPPAVTYYAPPPDYSYMYGWVPFPFWYASVWFPGYFILHDFHRTVCIDNRVVFVSNHFNDIRRQRIIRLDPIARTRGNNIANTRVIHTRGDIPARTPTRERAIIREPRMQAVSGNSAIRPAVSRGVDRSNVRNNISATPPARSSTSFGIPSRGSRTMDFNTRGVGGSGMFNSRSRTISQPSRGGGSDRMPFRGNNITGGWGHRR